MSLKRSLRETGSKFTTYQSGNEDQNQVLKEKSTLEGPWKYMYLKIDQISSLSLNLELYSHDSIILATLIR